ncbi:MAG: alpha/beta fold hydrolase [Baekduia sp.]
MVSRFTAAHRGGSGTTMVCLHGFTDTWRTWELVLATLERHHDVLAPTLTGHAGGPKLAGPVDAATLADGVERAMDDAGFGTAHLVGNSLGGYVALQLAARGRAESVVALAPAGGWARGDASYRETLALYAPMQAQLRGVVANIEALLSTPEGRRRATQLITTNFEHLPAELLGHQALGVVGCHGLQPMVDFAHREGYDLDAGAITCPVRIIWGTADRLLPWPSAAARYRDDWLPHADWIELDGIGHCPQLDVPTETAHLITGFTNN